MNVESTCVAHIAIRGWSKKVEESKKVGKVVFGGIRWCFKLTCRCVHGTSVTNDEAVSVETLAQLEKGAFNLEHRFQQVLLKLESCGKRNKITLYSRTTRSSFFLCSFKYTCFTLRTDISSNKMIYLFSTRRHDSYVCTRTFTRDR